MLNVGKMVAHSLAGILQMCGGDDGGARTAVFAVRVLTSYAESGSTE